MIMIDFAYRKYDNRFSNKNGNINRATTSFIKHNPPITKNSYQNVLTIARTRDGFSFVLYSFCQFL